MGEQKGSLWLVVIGLVLFGAMIFVAKPMMENMMGSINDKMQDTINSVNTGIPNSFGLDTAAYDEYVSELVG
ncbi:MAG: hypothetical protein ACRC3A_01845 [Culicoidibacterales bacterium]